MTAYSALQLARIVDISASSVRLWCREFEPFLSSGANPEPGKVRVFNEADLSVYVTVATPRTQQLSYDEIREKLELGERAEPIPQASPETTQDESGVTVAHESYTLALQSYEKQNSALQEHIDAMTERVIDAEKRAAAAEAKQELIDKLQADLEWQRRPWWKKFGDRGVKS